MWIGLFCGFGTGALWGLTFVAPRAVQPYGEIDLAVLRYCAFGLFSLLLMAADKRFRPGKLDARRILLALWLGLSGYVIYYLFVAFSIRYAGPAIAPLVIGALPVVLALIGNWQEKAVRWGALVLPLTLITAGLLTVQGGTLQAASTAAARADVLLGFALALGALGIWTSYAVVNARAMRAGDAPDALAWTSLQGVGAMAGVVPLILLAPLMGWSRVPELGVNNPEFTRLVLWALATGILGSWIAQLMWTIASKRLPLALSAQLIVSETLFALVYGFAFETRWPTPTEWTGGALLIAGVLMGVQVFSKHAFTCKQSVTSAKFLE
jgi:drug/metabolite transporter (DMT)-like permease